MTQNACPANVKVSKGSGPYSHPSAHLLSLDRTKWTVIGGPLDLLEDLREILVKPG